MFFYRVYFKFEGSFWRQQSAEKEWQVKRSQCYCQRWWGPLGTKSSTKFSEVFKSKARGCATIGDLEFAEDRTQMRLDGADADNEDVGDFGIGHALRHQPQNFDFALGQIGEIVRAAIGRG